MTPAFAILSLPQWKCPSANGKYRNGYFCCCTAI